jgi:hypothetical protein
MGLTVKGDHQQMQLRQELRTLRAMRSSLLPSVLAGLVAAIGCGGDDGDDSFEGTYARAACAHQFKCYPQIRRNFKDENACVQDLLANRQRNLDSHGANCAEVILDLWACESQAVCNTENSLDGPCGALQVNLRQECPDDGLAP